MWHTNVMPWLPAILIYLDHKVATHLGDNVEINALKHIKTIRTRLYFGDADVAVRDAMRSRLTMSTSLTPKG